MRHPLQRVCSAKLDGRDIVISACDNALQVVALDSYEVIASSHTAPDAHTGLIRLLAVDRDSRCLVSSGEDKLLKVWSLPTLTLQSTRELSRRANALTITADQQSIVVADKFGDVYSYPLREESIQTTPASGPSKQAPVMGHVSMLTSVVMTADGSRIITSDRDEHIRVSHWPQAFDIDTYLGGHRRFVSSLLLADSDRLLLSAGGDDEVYVWDMPSRKLRRKVDITALLAYCQVAPPQSPWAASKEGGRKKRKGKKGEQTAIGEAVVEPTGDANDLRVDADDPALVRAPTEDASAVPRLAINKLAQVGSGGNAVILISASGASALACLPLSSLVDAAEPTVAICDAEQPILDFCCFQDRVFLSLDRARGEGATAEPFCRYMRLGGGVLSLDPMEPTMAHLYPAYGYDKPVPDDTSLYAELALLHKDPADALPEATDGPRDHKPGRPAKKTRQS